MTGSAHVSCSAKALTSLQQLLTCLTILAYSNLLLLGLIWIDCKDAEYVTVLGFKITLTFLSKYYSAFSLQYCLVTNTRPVFPGNLIDRLLVIHHQSYKELRVILMHLREIIRVCSYCFLNMNKVAQLSLHFR